MMKPIVERIAQLERGRMMNDTFVVHEPPKDVVIPEREPPLDPHAWSALRRAHATFFSDALKHESSDAIIVDIGAGERHFRKTFDRFPNYVAMDFFPYDGIDIVADLNEPWPMKDASVDVVVASNVFEHMPDTQWCLEECRRILKPGGRFLVAVPFLLGVHQAPYDFVRHTHFSWNRMLDRAGFDVESMDASGTIADVITTLRSKMFQYLYEAKPCSSDTVNRLWVLGAKIMHRFIKMGSWIFNALFYRFAPKRLGFCLGYQFVAKKR